MLFNSIEFFTFLAIVLALYWQLSQRLQNLLLLVASYFFYGFWDVRYLSLLTVSTLVDYFSGLGIEGARSRHDEPTARRWLVLSVCVNLGILCTFKYFDFFSVSFAALAERVGWHVSPFTLNVVLPVGISFYTFQTMSYTIDVYRRDTPAERSLRDFALFVSFFPQLMAGPIERAGHLLPQLKRPRVVTAEAIRRGGWLLLWGLFKKVFVADNLALLTDWGILFSAASTSADILIDSVAFSIRFYCDFSGYSDMAIGMAALMGFELTPNFRLPYMVTNPARLIAGWHITLASWFRDYVYVPLLGRWRGSGGKAAAAIVTMGLVGLWHGANWGFVMWGASWGVLIAVYRVIKPFAARIAATGALPAAVVAGTGGLITFLMWSLNGMYIFAPTWKASMGRYDTLLFAFSASAYSFNDAALVVFYSWPIIAMQAAQKISGDMYVVRRAPAPLRVALYALMIVLLVSGGGRAYEEFIYFQF